MIEVFLFLHRNKRPDDTSDTGTKRPHDTSVPVCAQEQRDQMIQMFLFVHRNKETR